MPGAITPFRRLLMPGVVMLTAIALSGTAACAIRPDVSRSEPGTGAVVTRFEMVDERPFHLFVISYDLESFAHVHPMLQSNGDSMSRFRFRAQARIS
jgi:hypothetical protein